LAADLYLGVIPAGGRPHQWENGLITAKAISELDPNAVDYVAITVREQPFTIFLPTVLGGW
jgi:hypothetical protein